MWLLDVHSYQLVYFAKPPDDYAILSHTWRDEEVLFQDMQQQASLQTPISRPAELKRGWAKVQSTCEQARRNRYRYVWIDTCCIDKTSSAELSEAINSMFDWYARAGCCYAYLDDYGAESGPTAAWDPERDRESLARCRWFYRGWTLQELVASPNLILYGRDWTQIGTKETLQSVISSITGIDEDVLVEAEHRHALPVARRMSWASSRETTRDEDTAYCLLGIFGVNMPLLYGEGGERAFERLQRVVVARGHCDASLLAWTQDGTVPRYRGLLARSPAEFALCSKMAARVDGFFLRSRLVFTDSGELVITPGAQESGNSLRMKNAGASAKTEVSGLNLTQVFDFMGVDRGRHGESTKVGVRLQRFGDVYVRARPDVLEDPATFTTCFESSSRPFSMAGGGGHGMATPWGQYVAATTLSASHYNFIEIMLQRRLFLVYRRKLIRNLVEFNGQPPRLTALSSLTPRALELLEANRIDASHWPIILREADVGQGGGPGGPTGDEHGEPVWWDNLVVALGDGDKAGVRVRVSVVCGIPARPDAPSERVLPWFAVFCDRGACGGWGETSERNAEIGALIVSRLHTASGGAGTEAGDGAGAGSGRERQRFVGNLIFESYADARGSISQEKVPTVVMVRDREGGLHEIRVNRLGGGGGSTFAADVQYISRGSATSPTSTRSS